MESFLQDPRTLWRRPDRGRLQGDSRVPANAGGPPRAASLHAPVGEGERELQADALFSHYHPVAPAGLTILPASPQKSPNAASSPEEREGTRSPGLCAALGAAPVRAALATGQMSSVQAEQMKAGSKVHWPGAECFKKIDWTGGRTRVWCESRKQTLSLRSCEAGGCWASSGDAQRVVGRLWARGGGPGSPIPQKGRQRSPGWPWGSG